VAGVFTIYLYREPCARNLKNQAAALRPQTRSSRIEEDIKKFAEMTVDRCQDRISAARRGSAAPRNDRRAVKGSTSWAPRGLEDAEGLRFLTNKPTL
jgi:hypothetical protein